MRTLRVLIACVLLLSMSACATFDRTSTMGEFVKRELIANGAVHRYQVFVPARATGERKPPVILFLHGTGERGNDGEKQVQVGLGPHVLAHRMDFPATVVFPQAPDDREWQGDTAAMALAQLEEATREFNGDRNRTYLTGLSMGGYGTWELALMQPQRFAALVPVCGALLPPRDERLTLSVTPLAGEADPYTALAKKLRHVPAWIFHGTKDDVVPPDDARRTHAALRRVGADVRYTEFPDVSHNAWDPAYATPELWDWLFSRRR